MMEAARQRRRELDHARYIANREARLEKQKAYYAANREQCIASVRKCERNKVLSIIYFSMDEKIDKLVKQREQMIRLRNDSSLLQGVTIRTLAGDIRIEKPETALMLLDHIINDIQKQINYLLKI